MRPYIYIGIGGFLGANVRYVMSIFVARRVASVAGWGLPFGTLFVNVTGSFLLAMFLIVVDRRSDFPDDLRLLIATGFFGAYTTFSTYATDTVWLLRAGEWHDALANIVANNGLCLLGVVLGILVAERL